MIFKSERNQPIHVDVISGSKAFLAQLAGAKETRWWFRRRTELIIAGAALDDAVSEYVDGLRVRTVQGDTSVVLRELHLSDLADRHGPRITDSRVGGEDEGGLFQW
ncbi:hypothetical protein SAY86_024792 [Trapa natans]|uniref:Uncharacterized protein n=1 Tax=Trapa natans TaxID=22666 RepID=A0AAN7RDN9_TRANT|nr:hypothetical protein SAY86_024792 [Trapa natans]